MSFDVKSPTALGEAIDARVVCTKKNTHKDNENQPVVQKTAQEFSCVLIKQNRHR